MRPHVEMRVPRLKVSLYVLGLICSVLAELERDSPVMAMIHKTLVATARNCMSKVNATEADLEHLRKDPPFPEKSSCILKCLLEKVNQNHVSPCQLGNEITTCIFKYAPELQFNKIGH